jgi:hypothetical protein
MGGLIQTKGTRRLAKLFNGCFDDSATGITLARTLTSSTEEVLPSRRSQQHRRRVLSDLFKRFRRAFPEVTYELLWESPTINAQAWRLGSAHGPIQKAHAAPLCALP